MIVAVIPARGQSKRLPRKNLRHFVNRPLIAWSILAALKSPSIDVCVVSTEDNEIAEVAASYGAHVVARPVELAADDTPTADVIVHAVDQLHDRHDGCEGVVTLQPTNPLRPVGLIERAIAKFRESTCDSLVSVSQRPLKTGQMNDEFYVPSYPFGQQSRLTQPITFENGLIYITAFDTLRNKRSLCGERIIGFITEKPFDEVDIDDVTDLNVGQHVARAVLQCFDY